MFTVSWSGMEYIWVLHSSASLCSTDFTLIVVQCAKAACADQAFVCLFTEAWLPWNGICGTECGRAVNGLEADAALPHVVTQFRLTFHLLNIVSLMIHSCLLLEELSWQMHLFKDICPSQEDWGLLWPSKVSHDLWILCLDNYLPLILNVQVSL